MTHDSSFAPTQILPVCTSSAIFSHSSAFNLLFAWYAGLDVRKFGRQGTTFPARGCVWKNYPWVLNISIWMRSEVFRQFSSRLPSRRRTGRPARWQVILIGGPFSSIVDHRGMYSCWLKHPTALLRTYPNRVSACLMREVTILCIFPLLDWRELPFVLLSISPPFAWQLSSYAFFFLASYLEYACK
jgi:hypothetical protein